MESSIKNLVQDQLNLMGSGLTQPMPKFLNVLDLLLYLSASNNSTSNKTEAMQDNESLVNKYTEFLVANNINNNNSMLYQSDYLSVQIASSNPSAKEIADQQSIAQNLSLIDFKQCEDLLRSLGVIKFNESAKFSKTDWNAALKTNQTNTTSSADSVSYSLYTQSGVKINMSLCANTTTNIQMKISINQSIISNITDYNPYDLSSPYYSDICIPIPKNVTVATLDEKRKSFNSLGYICSTGCTFLKINVSTGYMSCQCNTSISNTQSTPEYGEIFTSVLNSTNIDILKCYYIFLKMVS